MGYFHQPESDIRAAVKPVVPDAQYASSNPGKGGKNFLIGWSHVTAIDDLSQNQKLINPTERNF